MEKAEHISKAHLKDLSALAVKKYRRREGKFIVEGETMLREAMDADWRVLEAVATEEWLGAHDDIIAALRSKRARIHAARDCELARLSDTVNPQAVVGIVACADLALKDISPKRCAVLAGVQDPGTWAR